MPYQNPKNKGAIMAGFERLLNDPNASPLTNPTTYRELMSAAGQPLSISLKHIGKKVKKEDPSKIRLEKLEAAHQANE